VKLADIKNPVGTLPGVGPAAAKLFAKINVFTVADLLTFYPKDYEDRTRRVPFSQFRNAKIHCAAVVTGLDWFGYGRMKTLKLLVSDGTLDAELIAFNRPFLEKQFPEGTIISVTGQFEIKYGRLQSTAFEITRLEQKNPDAGWNPADFVNIILPDSGVLPVYPLTEGLNQKNVRKTIAAALRGYVPGIADELPDYIIQSRHLLSKKDAVRFVHQPQTVAQAHEARHTLIYEELFQFQCVIAGRAWEHKGIVPAPSLTFSVLQDTIQKESPVPETFAASLSPRQKELLLRLPFPLTGDQQKVIMEMDDDLDRGYRERAALLKNIAEGTYTEKQKPVFTMARLLQGDVGSGKTLVAFFVCLRVIDWNGQCAIMAPTELLARQHAETAARLLEPLGIRVAFLTGNIKAAGRSQLLKQLKEGNVDIVIGTHALFSQQVVYNDLQFAVIDEQHRFGVLQRQAIIEKGRKIEGTSSYTLHLLMMSATPIPQTLALTVFGDLDVSVLRTMPAGRQPVQTYLVAEGHESNAYEAVRKELQAGHQAYFVYPAIEADERTYDGENSGSSTDEADGRASPQRTAPKSAEEMFAYLSQKVYPEFRCALVHSRVDENEQIQILDEFREGKTQVLAATTVIEVGVDIPNATCIVIEQADRFGLAQLHQLRGRVGRGSEQSYCFFIYSKNITEAGIQRMKALRENTDGFIIAEQDLKLRGPGEVTGTIQAGNLQLGIADIERDRDILVQARMDAFAYMKKTLPTG
jgi:ATP-dependent DNA helicase RecG